jgi:hypothetical protein
VFAVGVFLSAFFFNLGLVLSEPSSIGSFVIRSTDRVLLSLFNSFQMIDAGKDFVKLDAGALTHRQLVFVMVVHHLLYVLSPIAFLGAVASYVSRFLSLPRAALRARLHPNTYVFSELGTHSLTLARNIRNKHKHRANLVFASVDRDADDELQIEATSLGALCVEDSIDMVWRRLFGRRHLRLVLVGEDEVSNITRAASISKTCKAVASKRVVRNMLRSFLFDKKHTEEWMEKYGARVSIYSVTSLYGAESLLDIGEQNSSPAANGSIPVRIRRIDWTRNLVESTLNEHPLFLLGKQPPMSADDDSGHENNYDRNGYVEWQNSMLHNDKRHVVIVGAGHVGMEFLRLALSSSRFTAPTVDEPLSFRFDVFDNAEDPLHPGEPRALRKLEAEAPYLTSRKLKEEFNVHFHVTDVFDPEFTQTLEKVNSTHGGITYVFISLGDDLASVQTAMMVRETLERMRVHRNAAKPAGQRQTSYLSDPKPIVLAIVDDDNLSESLSTANDDGFDYQIETIGSYEDMYTFDLVFGDDIKSNDVEKSEYKRRSTRASALHKKYKLFAYMRHIADEETKKYAVDWSEDLTSAINNHANDETMAAINKYNEYVTSTIIPDHEWLLRMEHDRWNAYMWAEGFVAATLADVETFFNTCQTKERHRLNGANMHPCLLPFDKLKELDKPIDAWYDEALESCTENEREAIRDCKRYNDEKRDGDMYGKHKPFELQDNDYLAF